MEDVRLGLEKLPDRFVEHKNTVFVISNLNYVESTNLKSNNRFKQKMNWKVVKLTGNSSLDFSTQLRLNQDFLAKNGKLKEILKQSYLQRAICDCNLQERSKFILKDVIPKNNGKITMIL